MNALLIAIALALAAGSVSAAMRWPVDGPITSPYGDRVHPITGVESFHNGVDIEAPTGTPVIAPAPGTVASTYYHERGGYSMLVDMGDLRMGLAHLSAYELAEGDQFAAGEVLAFTGATGAVTGPHLHLTLRKDGELVDPADYFTGTWT